MKSIQYTIRNIPSYVDETLRQKAKSEGKSINEVAVEAITFGAGLSDKPLEFHDLDALVGSWKNDPKFDEAIRDQDKIDMDLWK